MYPTLLELADDLLDRGGAIARVRGRPVRLTRADPETMGVSGPLTMDTAGAEMYATIFSLMLSAHQPGVMMTGSDDGLVHVSTDDGESWNDVTPDGLPANSQVTMLAESPHTAGTVWTKPRQQ